MICQQRRAISNDYIITWWIFFWPNDNIVIGVASQNECSDKWIQGVGVNLSVASCEMYLKIGQCATDISTNQMKQKGTDLSERFGLRSCNLCEQPIWRA